MPFTPKDNPARRRMGALLPFTTALRSFARPLHAQAVHDFRVAAESGDGERLALLLDPAVAVVVDSGETRNKVDGTFDAVAILLHGMAVQPGQVVFERTVNGQAGLLLSRYDELTAVITVDFVAGLVSAVWIRLQPALQTQRSAA